VRSWAFTSGNKQWKHLLALPIPRGAVNAAKLIISIHTWVGLRWQSFVVTSAVGTGAMVVAVLLFQSDWSEWYPWTLAGVVNYRLDEGLNAGAFPIGSNDPPW
jgi:hypothetical protein